MNVTGVGVRSSLVVQMLGDMRTQLGDLQLQLGTGKKSTTYAGLGINLLRSDCAGGSRRLRVTAKPSRRSASGSTSLRPRWAVSPISGAT